MGEIFLASEKMDLFIENDMELQLKLHNAEQSVVMGIHTSHEIAVQKLRDEFKLGTEAEAVMTTLHDYSLEMADKIQESDLDIPVREFTQFYSLIYHLLDQGTPETKNEQDHIKKVFAALDLGEPIPKETISKAMRGILQFAEKRIKGQ